MTYNPLPVEQCDLQPAIEALCHRLRSLNWQVMTEVGLMPDTIGEEAAAMIEILADRLATRAQPDREAIARIIQGAIEGLDHVSGATDSILALSDRGVIEACARIVDQSYSPLANSETQDAIRGIAAAIRKLAP